MSTSPNITTKQELTPELMEQLQAQNPNAQLSKAKQLDKGYKVDIDSTPHYSIVLPTGGKIYSSDSSMHKGELKARFMVGRDEDILTSPTFLQNNETFDKLLEAVVLDAKFNVSEMTLVDRSAALLQIRIANLDNKFKFPEPEECKKCGSPIEDIDLFNVKDITLPDFPDPTVNEIPVYLEKSKMTVILKLPTVKDIREARKFNDQAQKKNNDQYSSLTIATYVLRDQDGKELKEGMPFQFKVSFVGKLPIADTAILRKKIQELSNGVEPVIVHTCEHCSTENDLSITTTDIGFFFQ
jgi:hypothetical protein